MATNAQRAREMLDRSTDRNSNGRRPAGVSVEQQMADAVAGIGYALLALIDEVDERRAEEADGG